MANALMAPSENLHAECTKPPSEAPVDHDRSFLVEPSEKHREFISSLGYQALIHDLQPRTFERDEVREDSRNGRSAWGNDLPPREVWEINPWRTLFETPTDSRGLVDVKKLVTLGKITVREGYVWDTSQTRDDHLYWPYEAYAQLAARLDDSLPLLFRNLPSNRIRFPLTFERWKHAITIPSDFPSLEVMHHSVESWVTAHRLFVSAHEAALWEKRRRNREAALREGRTSLRPKYEDDRIAQEFIADTLAAHFKGVAIGLERHQKVPPEFRLIQPNHTMHDILRVMGYQARNHCRDGMKAVMHTAA